MVVTRDERAEREKGRRPVNSLERRMKMLSTLDVVDQVLPGDPVGKWGTVRRIRPDVICIGHDQRKDHPKFLAQLEGLESAPCIIRLDAYQRDKYSTSRMIAESDGVGGAEARDG